MLNAFLPDSFIPSHVLHSASKTFFSALLALLIPTHPSGPSYSPLLPASGHGVSVFVPCSFLALSPLAVFCLSGLWSLTSCEDTFLLSALNVTQGGLIFWIDVDTAHPTAQKRGVYVRGRSYIQDRTTELEDLGTWEEENSVARQREPHEQVCGGFWSR